MIELTPTIKIKLAAQAEINVIAKMQVDALEMDYPKQPLNPALKQLFINELEQRWHKQLSLDSDILLLIDQEIVIGFAIYCYHQHNESPLAEMSSIYIIPDKRRNHLGHLFCKAVFNEIKKNNITKIFSWLLEENVNARQFYFDLGFSPTEKIRHDTIGDGVTIREIRYELALCDQNQH